MSSKRKSSSNRSARAVKTKDYVYEDEEEAFSNNFDITEKLKSSKFSKFFLQEMRGEDVNLEELAGITKNFSGAELEGLVRAAQSCALNRFAP